MARPDDWPVGRPWWAHEAFGVGPCGLTLDGRCLAGLAREHGTPLYVYSLGTVRSRLGRLRAALGSVGAPHRVYYALKANRHRDVLGLLRPESGVGVDACSPREARLAVEAGFGPDEVSVTTSMLSDRDLDELVALGVHLNLDSRSALRRYSARTPFGTAVGLRLDPPAGRFEGADPEYVYADGRFGIPLGDLVDVAAEARAAGLTVDTLHVHCGWNLPAAAAGWLSDVLGSVAAAAGRLPTVRTVNVGGGLSPGFGPDETPLSLEVWTELLRRHLGPLGVTIACEPGTYLVAEAGVLLVEVNTVEAKGGHTWVGVDAGHPVYNFPAMYGGRVEVVHVARPADAPIEHYQVAGHINEVRDVFARDRALPELREGDVLAFVRVGAYGASMASDHCLRGQPAEVAILPG